ncbi:inorganic phosphate transporter [Acetobacter persici]|uniref:Inorganic phosphate transporter n=1 Tax=Acetobacter persici TaxID=1076596 RepID=A0A1U9LJE9_9PROT|nr:inorganic phosphate transporter [Acetobacter persici]AQT06420.1 hypothetical protein A0U91_15515 [Acetobacter persici]
MATLVAVIALALIFDFTNGRHDAALITSPVTSTGTLTIRQAAIFTSVCSFFAFLIFGLHVADTLGHGLVNPNSVTLKTIATALISASAWNIFAQRVGVPTSSSHALIGGLIGAVIASNGLSSVIWSGLLPIIAAIFVAPTLGFVGSIMLTRLSAFPTNRLDSLFMNRFFRPMQILACGVLALSHGSNDAQKTMGIITLALFSTHTIPTDDTPLWVVLMCQAAMALGTISPQPAAMTRAISRGIARTRPWQGAVAQGSAGIVLSLATICGIPVSSTHVQTGTLAGVGALHSLGRVRWRTILRMLISWIATIPASAAVAMGITILLRAVW